MRRRLRAWRTTAGILRTAACALLFAGAAASSANAQATPSAGTANAQAAPGADATIVPAPPAGATAVQNVQAGGVQIYACRAAATGNFAWVLVGPKAILVNADGSDFGTHGAGPQWTASDGSSIVADGAHPLVKIDRPGSAPALLLAVRSTTGSGILTGVRFVRRADTQGGAAPADGCDAAHAGVTVARHYSAVYTFYR